MDMKKLLACILCAMAANAANAQNETRIQTDIKGLSEGDTLALQWGATNKSATPYIMKRGAVGDSAFTIRLSEPRLLVLSLDGGNATYEILASPGEDITVSGRIRKLVMAMGTDTKFRKMTVKGASLQQKYDGIISKYQQHVDSIDSKVYNEYKDVVKLISKAKETNNEQAIADMYQTLHGQSYVERVMSTFMERADHMKSVVSAHKDSFFGPLLLLKLVGRLDKTYKPLYDDMSAEARQSYYGREVKDEVDPPVITGNQAPTATVFDKDGKEKELSFANTGSSKYILLDFWASWCQPCHKEIPNLKRIYNKYHAKGLDIIGISADQSEEEWTECLESAEEPWDNYIDIDREAIDAYNVQYIPSIFVIDKSGKIIAEKLRGKELSDFVDGLFEQE